MNRIIEVTRRGLRGEAAGVGMAGTVEHDSSALQLTFADQGKVIWTDDASPGAITLPLITTIGDGWHCLFKVTYNSQQLTVNAPAGATIDDASGKASAATSFVTYVGQTVIVYFDGGTIFTVMRFQRDWDGPYINPTNTDRELTIATGAITAYNEFHTVDTEANAASDDLDTINGGTMPGQKLTLCSNFQSRDVTVKNGTGNISCGSDRILSHPNDTISFVYFQGTWRMTSFADNAT